MSNNYKNHTEELKALDYTHKIITFNDEIERETFIGLYKNEIYKFRKVCESGEIKLYVIIKSDTFNEAKEQFGLEFLHTRKNRPDQEYWRKGA